MSLSDDDSQIEPNTEDLGQSVGQNSSEPPLKMKYRPNNSFLRVRILKWSPNFHLPVAKITGRNTPKEYEYWTNATFERTLKSNWLFVYPKKRFGKFIQTDADVDKVNQEYKQHVTDIIYAFQQKYAESVDLDITNASFIIKEFELIHPQMKLPKNLRFKDTVGKKVYNNTGMEFYSPTYVKNAIGNVALLSKIPKMEENLEKFGKELGDLAEQIREHRALIQDYRQESSLHRQFMEKQIARKSWWQRIMEVFKK